MIVYLLSSEEGEKKVLKYLSEICLVGEIYAWKSNAEAQGPPDVIAFSETRDPPSPGVWPENEELQGGSAPSEVLGAGSYQNGSRPLPLKTNSQWVFCSWGCIALEAPCSLNLEQTN